MRFAVGYKNLSRKAKLLLYKTIIRPTVTYSSGTSVYSTEANDKRLRTWERRVLRRIFGPVRQDDVFRARTNTELKKNFSEPNIVQVIK